MASEEPIIVVLGPRCGGTSAVSGVLHHLGVYMGTEFSMAYRELQQSWEELGLHQLCVRAFSEPGDRLQIDPDVLTAALGSWADQHRRAARAAGRRPGAKDPVLCLAIEFLRDAWREIVPVVVDRPVDKVVASLNRLGWLSDEEERAESTARLIAARDLALADSSAVRVDFEELRATPVVVIRRLAQQLGLDITEDQVQAAVDSVVRPPDLPRDVDPYQRLIDEFLPKAQLDPTDARSVSMLAQVYFDSGDYANAHTWFARKLDIGGIPDEETFLAKFRIAESTEKMGAPWHEVQDLYLLAWEFRPSRAEPLYCVARQHFNEKRYRLAYLFATHAADIPRPDGDMFLPYPDIFTWRAADAQAKSAFCLGEHAIAFSLWRQLLTYPDIPDGERQRIAVNRDEAVPAILEAVSSYPDTLVRNSIAAQGRVRGHHRRASDAEVTVSLIAGPDLVSTQQALNSFLNSCHDVSLVGRFLLIDSGMPADDREMLEALYDFLEFVQVDSDGVQLGQIRQHVNGRFWLHLDQNWRFFAPDNLITRLTAVFEAEADVFQVAVNLAGAFALTGESAPEDAVRRTPDAGRYVLLDGVTSGPAMFDTARLDLADSPAHTAAALQTASLDEVLCIAAD